MESAENFFYFLRRWEIKEELFKCIFYTLNPWKSRVLFILYILYKTWSVHALCMILCWSPMIRRYNPNAHSQNEQNELCTYIQNRSQRGSFIKIWRVKCNGKCLKHKTDASDCVLALHHLKEYGTISDSVQYFSTLAWQWFTACLRNESYSGMISVILLCI